MQETVICTFRVKPGCETQFEELLRAHYPALHKMGLVTDTPPLHFKSNKASDNGGFTYTHIFEWVDSDGSRKAHESPEIGKIWGPMGEICEDRDGRPAMEFPHVTPLKL